MIFQGFFRPLAAATAVVIMLLCTAGRSNATGTHFDLLFDDNGKLATDFGDEDRAQAVAIQTDGKIVAVGYVSNSGGIIAIARYNSNGSLDTSFDGDGKVSLARSGGKAFGVALQSDGKIVVVGTIRNAPFSQPAFAILRLTTNGSLDSTFGANGQVLIDIAETAANTSSIALGVAIQSDGKILAVGSMVHANGDTGWAICRLLTNGDLDSTFVNGGKTNIVFGGVGSSNAAAVTVTATGRILIVGTVAGIANEDFGILALTPAGVRDDTFAGGLSVRDFAGGNDDALAIALHPSGRVIVGGSAVVSGHRQFAIMEFSAAGLLIGAVGNNGRLTTDVSPSDGSFIKCLAIQPDGKVVAVGESDNIGLNESNFAIARYNIDGTLDAAFGQGGVLRSDLNNHSDDTANAIAIGSNGKLVVAGSTRNTTAGSQNNFGLARYLPNMDPRFDFDGDSYADLSVVRGDQGNFWYLLKSTEGSTSTTFGLPTDRLIPADYDGDAITDIGVYRPSTGTWYWIRSSTNSFTSTPFGVAEDLPTPADYDGDGRADISVFRPSVGTWYRLNSSTGAFVYVVFGTNGDKPTMGDFDGDGRADIATFRPSSNIWYRLNSGDNAFVQVPFGAAGDIPAPGDFDGDAKTDVAVFRASSGSWYRYNSTDGALVSHQFGMTGDIPTVSDYDRDGKDDISVFRNSSGIWYRINSSLNTLIGRHYGVAGDKPVPAAFNY